MNNKTIDGFNIYFDKHNNAIYYNFIRKIGYRLDINSIQTFNVLRNRFVVSVIAFILFKILFSSSLIFACVVALITLIILQIRWNKYLNQLPMITNFNPKSYHQQNQKNNDKFLVLKTILYFILSILLIINCLTPSIQKQLLLVGLSIIIALVALVIAIQNTYIIIKNHKH